MSLKLSPLIFKFKFLWVSFDTFQLKIDFEVYVRQGISKYVSSHKLNNLPGSSTRDTKTVKNVKSYVKKVDEEENDVAKGAVIPEKYENAM